MRATHRRAPDGGRHPRLAARVPRRGLPRDRRPARARAPCSTSAAAWARRPLGLAAPDRARHRRRLRRRHRRSTPAQAPRAPSGLRFAAMDGARLGIARPTPIDWVCSSHIIEHFAAPERHVAELARVVHRRRHRVRDHAEPPRRLREPVPRVPVRGRRARVAARDCSSTTSRCTGLEGSPELHDDFAAPARERREAPQARPAATCASRCRAAGTCGATSACCRSSTGVARLASAPASARASTSRTSSSPTRSRPPPPASSPSPATPASELHDRNRRQTSRSAYVARH